MAIDWDDVDESLKRRFLMDGNVKLLHWPALLNESYTLPHYYSKEIVNELIEKAKNRKMNYYGSTDVHLYSALDKFPIEGQKVVILGSTRPWYESVCISRGAKPLTIDYSKIASDHPAINAITIEQFNKSPRKFNFAISISSFEHDGLTRYGDPLDPDGDFKAMENVRKNVLNKGGILFFSVPVGQDTLVWNAHRIYGEHRLPKLLEGFEILNTFGFNERSLHTNTGTSANNQPIFVLRVK